MGWQKDRLRVLDMNRQAPDAAPSLDEDEDEQPCESSRPCRVEYRSDDDLCCTHGGLCHIRAHLHFDADDYFDWVFEEHVAGREERGR